MDDATIYHHGDQEISAQAHTYKLFGVLTKWFSLHLAALLVVLVLWFCLGVSFFGGLIPGIIVLALGIAFLREKPKTGQAH
ncbi:MAG TPA: aa3-type cytochrome c oxidase subunit IV [Caulobacteraceae bacterium]|jgi:thiamine transporter ThiT|nr:aa3-type cytochrome c oxidase subunit IV [Caulobacteraceae bacterium]